MTKTVNNIEKIFDFFTCVATIDHENKTVSYNKGVWGTSSSMAKIIATQKKYPDYKEI